MSEKVVLYSYYRSSASWRVRIALALKKIKYEYKAVHLVKGGGEHHSEEYKKINPLEQLPTLKIDGASITQSLAIIEYLEEKIPEPSLFPDNFIGKAKVRSLSEIINSGIQPLQNMSVLQKIGDGKEEWANFYITKGLAGFEESIKTTAGLYCYGNEVTMVDLCLVPQIYNARRFNVDLDQFPTTMKVYDNLVKLPAFIAADPSRQPDTPVDQRAS